MQNIFFGLIGGFLMNFMPCVLPVISMKLMAIISQSSIENSKKIRLNMLYNALGIILVFVVLFLLIIAFPIFLTNDKGIYFSLWGGYMQNPYFIYFLSLIVLFFLMNCNGVIGFGFTNKKQNKQDGFIYYFFSGILTTILATPCIGPFVGYVMVEAFTSNSIFKSLTLILSVSIGLALPYIIMSIRPKLLLFLPKPGKWMEKLSKLNDILLIGTIIWLLFAIFSVQISYKIATIVAILLIIIYQIAKKIPNRFYLFLAILLSSVVVCSFIKLSILKKESKKVDLIALADEELLYKKYQEIINQEDKYVMTFLTANWCVWCKILEYNAINHNDFKQYLYKNKEKFTYIKFDLTDDQGQGVYGKFFPPIDGQQRYSLPTITIANKKCKINVDLNSDFIVTNKILIKRIEEAVNKCENN